MSADDIPSPPKKRGDKPRRPAICFITEDNRQSKKKEKELKKEMLEIS
jgi:hypothetical protein